MPRNLNEIVRSLIRLLYTNPNFDLVKINSAAITKAWALGLIIYIYMGLINLSRKENILKNCADIGRPIFFLIFFDNFSFNNR